MARYIYPTAEEQIEKHLGGVLISDEVREELRYSLQPMAIMVKGGETYYSCCQDYHDSMGVSHRTYAQCPICGRTAYHVKQCHIRKEERQENYHYLYRRSQTERDTIIIIGVWVVQKWMNVKYSDPDRVELVVQPNSLIVIPYGGKPARYVWERGWYSEGGAWHRRSKINGGCYTSWTGGGIKQINHTDERWAAIEGTRFEKMARWFMQESNIYHSIDWAEVLAKFAKYPQMEYLVARGLGGLVKDKLNGWTFDVVNWKAKTVEKMLPLTRDELGRIKAKGYNIRSRHLMIMRIAREMGQPIKLEVAMAATAEGAEAYAKTLVKALKTWGGRYGVVKTTRYLTGKINPWDMNMWLDYMGELTELGGLDDLGRVFPKDLHDAHRETSTRIKVRQSEADQKKLEEILPNLRKAFTFEAGGVKLEPFPTLAEVIREGQEQSICIGSYAQRYAAGRTILCKMRRTAAPDSPWHAVEFDTKGNMVQCRGAGNRTNAEDEPAVRAFWAAWDKAHKTKTRVDISIRQRQQTA